MRRKRRLPKRSADHRQHYDAEDIDSMRGRLLKAKSIYKKLPYFRVRPDECRRVLTEFVAAAEGAPGIDQETAAALMRFAAAAFKLFLSRKAKSLDQAFGLVQSRGNRPSDEVFLTRYSAAVDVAGEMDRGATLEDACAAVAERWKKQGHPIKESYARDAYVAFRTILQRKRSSR